MFNDCQEECRKADVTAEAVGSLTIQAVQKVTGLSEK